jgi:predicted Fe-S protein YdhL (DUF1289 family)
LIAMTNRIVAEIAHQRIGYPFGFSQADFSAEQRLRDTLDLQVEISAGRILLEHFQWLAMEHAESNDGSRDYVEGQLPAMVDELERRRRLWMNHSADPLRPRWPNPNADGFTSRIASVREAWPIERFCRELLLLDLIPTGRGKWKARCPLPGHDDRTPSFAIDSAKNVGYCHGCQRGGDVLKLAQYVLNAERFLDALAALEREGGVR